MRVSESYFCGSGLTSHAPGDPGGINVHSGVHRCSNSAAFAAGGCGSCPGGQKFTQSGMSTPGTHGIGIRMHLCLACAKG